MSGPGHPLRSNWLKLVFKLRGSLIPHLFVELVLVAIVGFIAALFEAFHFSLATLPVFGPVSKEFGSDQFLDDKVHTIIIFPLGFLLIFRSNISFARYWEGRTLVGDLIKGVRELTRNIAAYHEGEKPEDVEERAELRRLVNMLYELMAQHLQFQKGHRNVNAIRMMKKEERTRLRPVTNRVQVVAAMLTQRVAKNVREGKLSTTAMILIDNKINSMVESWMGADKIVKTPLPYPYVQMLNALLFIYVYTVPFTFAKLYGWFTPVMAMLICLALLGINKVASEIEMPFGSDENDLPLDAFGMQVANDSITIIAQRDPQSRQFNEDWIKAQLIEDGTDAAKGDDFGIGNIRIKASDWNVPTMPSMSSVPARARGLFMA